MAGGPTARDVSDLRFVVNGAVLVPDLNVCQVGVPARDDLRRSEFLLRALADAQALLQPARRSKRSEIPLFAFDAETAPLELRRAALPADKIFWHCYQRPFESNLPLVGVTAPDPPALDGVFEVRLRTATAAAAPQLSRAPAHPALRLLKVRVLERLHAPQVWVPDGCLRLRFCLRHPDWSATRACAGCQSACAAAQLRPAAAARAQGQSELDAAFIGSTSYMLPSVSSCLRPVLGIANFLEQPWALPMQPASSDAVKNFFTAGRDRTDRLWQANGTDTHGYQTLGCVAAWGFRCSAVWADLGRGRKDDGSDVFEGPAVKQMHERCKKYVPRSHGDVCSRARGRHFALEQPRFEACQRRRAWL